MSGVSFTGLATGLDTASIVSQLVELKRQPIYRLQNRKQGFQNQISALGTLKSKLIALQDAAKKLDTASEFSSLKTGSNNEDFLTATASDGAAPGSYSIQIESLAVAQKDVSQGFASLADSVGSGTMSITVDGETTDLNLTGYTSLDALKNLINDNVAGVSASIINDGSGATPYRLVLSGAEAGTANAFSVDMSGMSGGVTPILTNQNPASDASLFVDGIHVTATSNNPDDVISGLTLNLLDADITLGTTVQLNVEVDDEGIGENVKGMVDAYNDLFSFVTENMAAEGVLRDNPTLRAVASRIENIFVSSNGGTSGITMLAHVGISRGDARQIKWDEEKFADALNEDFGGVRDLFIERNGNLGKSSLIDIAVEGMTDSIDGLFKISTDALNKKIDYADQSIERYERSIESYRLTMERKFTAMESMVSQLQAQGSYLSSVLVQ